MSLRNGNQSDMIEGYSIEVLPGDLANFADQLVGIKQPSAVLIPALNGEQLNGQVDAAAEVRLRGFEPVCHIAARRIASAEQLDRHLSDLVTKARIESLLLIAGDLAAPVGPFADTTALIERGLLTGRGLKSVMIAGHPDGHPAVPEPVLMHALRNKADALTDIGLSVEIATQFSFDAEAVLTWIAKVRSIGIDAPIRVGIAGPANLKTLLRYARICGVNSSAKALAKYGLSIGRLVGSAGPDKFVRRLADGVNAGDLGNVSLHIFPFGGFAQTRTWLATATKSEDMADTRILKGSLA